MLNPAKLTGWIALTVFFVALLAAATGAQTMVVAGSETSVIASAQTGTYVDTQAAFDTVETLTEAESGGNPRKRKSELEHVWHFTVPSGPSATLFVRAARTDSGEGDAFAFEWSSDQGQNYNLAYTLTHTALPAQPDAVALPAAATGGAIWIRVVDTDRTQGRTALDTLTVDYLAIVVDPPAPPPPSDFVLERADTGPGNFRCWIYTTYDAQGRFGAIWEREGPNFPEGDRRLVEARATGWVHSTLPGSNTGDPNPTGLAYDATDAPVAITGPGRIARRDPVGGWQEEVFDSAAVQGGALTIDRATGEIFLAYRKRGQKRNDPYSLWIARKALGGTWIRQLVDGDVLFAQDPSIALDSAGRPGIAYRKGSGRDEALGYAHWNGATWDVEIVELDGARYGWSPTLAYRPVTGEPAITHGSERFVHRVGAAWQPQVAPNALDGGAITFAFDTFGDAHVAYRENSGAIVVLAWNGSSWGNRRIVDARSGVRLWGGRFLSIEPASQEIAVAYQYPWQGDFWIGRRTPGQ